MRLDAETIAAKDAKIAELSNVISKGSRECEQLGISLQSWLAANAPGGWIDELRVENARLTDALYAIADFTNGYGDVGGIAYKMAKAALLNIPAGEMK